MGTYILLIITSFFATINSVNVYCNLVLCQKLKPIDCIEKNEIFLPPSKNQCCPTCSSNKPTLDCSTVLCQFIQREDCVRMNKMYLPADDKNCCAKCVENPRKWYRSQRCRKIKPEDCLNQGLAFIPKGMCHKCAQCRHINDMTEPTTCLRGHCMNPQLRCIDETIVDCQPNQMLIPRSSCNCCTACANVTIPCHSIHT